MSTKRHARQQRKLTRAESFGVRPGSSPGQLVAVEGAARARVRVLAYGPQGLEERAVTRVEELRGFIGHWPTTWIDVQGVTDVETISGLGEMLRLHRLALEDVTSLGHRAKLDDYDEHLFLVFRLPNPAEPHDSEQVSLFLGPDYVVTFQQREGDPFDPVRGRIRAGKGRIRTGGPDYLAYALLDAAIDVNFPILEAVGQRLEQIERQVVEGPSDASVTDLLRLRSELLTLRKDLLPHRDLLQSMIRAECTLIKPATTVFLRDCGDHVDQLVDLLLVYREVSSDLMTCYMSNVSNRMNEVMKVLTMVATVFIPLSFIAGVYGMNFDTAASPLNMPELHWYLGYPLALGLMLAVALGMLVMFRRMGWLGGRRRARLTR